MKIKDNHRKGNLRKSERNQRKSKEIYENELRIPHKKYENIAENLGKSERIKKIHENR